VEYFREFWWLWALVGVACGLAIAVQPERGPVDTEPNGGGTFLLFDDSSINPDDFSIGYTDNLLISVYSDPCEGDFGLVEVKLQRSEHLGFETVTIECGVVITAPEQLYRWNAEVRDYLPVVD